MELECNIKEDMKSLGCTSVKKINLACHLYIYLIDTKLMYDVQYQYNKEIDTLFIIARPGKKTKLNIYVPFPTTEDVRMDIIELLQEKLCTEETGPTVNLAFIEGDLTTVLYSFTKGLIPLEAPEGLSQRKNRYERNKIIDKQLKKNCEKIIREALDDGVRKVEGETLSTDEEPAK